MPRTRQPSSATSLWKTSLRPQYRSPSSSALLTAFPLYQRTVTPNADRTYSLPDIPSKTYTLRVKGAKWLTAKRLLDTTAGDVSEVNLTLLTGDANNDNSVDIQDLLLLIHAYNHVFSDADYLGAADFDDNGANDVFDLTFVIANYNKKGD